VSAAEHARRTSEGVMARMTAAERSRRARAAALSRHHKGDDREAAAAARAQTKADGLERRIRAMVDTWPPLSPDQRNKLAALLLGGGDGLPPAPCPCPHGR
jgi:hypothetical protein